MQRTWNVQIKIQSEVKKKKREENKTQFEKADQGIPFFNYF